MAVDIEVEANQALQLDHLAIPSDMKILRIEAKDYTDWDGEPSLRVLVVIDDAVEVEKVSGSTVSEFKSALRESLRNHGITRFPYIFFAKPSELAETEDED